MRYASYTVTFCTARMRPIHCDKLVHSCIHGVEIFQANRYGRRINNQEADLLCSLVSLMCQCFKWRRNFWSYSVIVWQKFFTLLSHCRDSPDLLDCGIDQYVESLQEQFRRLYETRLNFWGVRSLFQSNLITPPPSLLHRSKRVWFEY